MKALRLRLSLAVCVPGFALLGAIAAADTYFPSWGGGLIGATLGVFFGLVFGGALPRAVADYCFGPEEPVGEFHAPTVELRRKQGADHIRPDFDRRFHKD